MIAKPYILLVQVLIGTVKDLTTELRGVRRVLGVTATTILATEQCIATGFISTSPASEMLERLKNVLGGRVALLVWELGKDVESFGFPHHHAFVSRVHWWRKDEAYIKAGPRTKDSDMPD